MSKYLGKRNDDLRQAKGDIPFWLLGEKLGVHEVTVTRWFRLELSPEKRQKILKAIEEIRQERA